MKIPKLEYQLQVQPSRIIRDFQNNPGVYSIISKKSNRIYIGSASNLRTRWLFHRNCLIRNSHVNGALQNFWDTDGENYIFFKILQFCVRERLSLLESQYLDFVNPTLLLNITKQTKGITGKDRSKVTKRKISKALKGIKRSKETKMKISRAKKGTILSEETKAKMKIAQRLRRIRESGVPPSVELPSVVVDPSYRKISHLIEG